MFLDEAWLAAVLTRQPAPLAAVEEAGGVAAVSASPAPVQLSPAAETPIAHARAEPAVSRHVDWVGAPDVSHFAGRRKRSATVIEQSALVGKFGQWENPLLYSLRDGLIPLAFATLLPRLFGALVSLPS
jgi:hypothetical protein